MYPYIYIYTYDMYIYIYVYIYIVEILCWLVTIHMGFMGNVMELTIDLIYIYIHVGIILEYDVNHD